MRSVNGTIRKNRRIKLLKRAKGFRAGRGVLFRTAKDAVMKAGLNAFRDRKLKKRDFRTLWIARINAAVRPEGISYSVFMNGLSKANVQINRKILSEIAIHNPEAFRKVVEVAKAAK